MAISGHTTLSSLLPHCRVPWALAACDAPTLKTWPTGPRPMTNPSRGRQWCLLATSLPSPSSPRYRKPPELSTDPWVQRTQITPSKFDPLQHSSRGRRSPSLLYGERARSSSYERHSNLSSFPEEGTYGQTREAKGRPLRRISSLNMPQKGGDSSSDGSGSGSNSPRRNQDTTFRNQAGNRHSVSSMPASPVTTVPIAQMRPPIQTRTTDLDTLNLGGSALDLFGEVQRARYLQSPPPGQHKTQGRRAGPTAGRRNEKYERQLQEQQQQQQQQQGDENKWTYLYWSDSDGVK